MASPKPKRKHRPKKRNDAGKTQAERFKEAARQSGADKTGGAFERAIGKILPPKRASNLARAKTPAK